MINIVPPALILIVGSLLVPFLKERVRQVYMIALPLLTVLYLFNLSEGIYWKVKILNYELIFGRVDRLSLAFGYIFAIITFISSIYSLHVKDNLHLISAFVYAGGAQGAVFAGDFVTLFIFWEIMAFAAAYIVWSAKTKPAINAGMRYLMVHIFGGLLLLGGIMIHYHETGSLLFNYVGLKGLSSWLIFLGFGINAAFPVLHAWLPDAYPESTETGTVFLSAFTTKTAVYVLARGFPGTEILIYIGAAMTVFPIFYGVIENNLRRVLSYSLIDQMGFMVTGIGIGTQLSLNGTVAHAFCHILYKALLFMSMGAVLYRTGKINATDLGGLYKSMPLTTIFCIVGAASISGVPLTNGFVSKSMIISASAEGGMLAIWIALLFASAGVLLYSGIKIPFFAFFSHDSGIRTKEAPTHMLVAMGLAAFLCIGIGVLPGPLYSILPYPVNYEPYTAAHVIDKTQLLAFSALAFTLLMLSGIYPPEIRSVNLDADWFYRKGTAVFMKFANNVLAKLEYNIIGQAYEFMVIKPMLKIAEFLKIIDTSGVDGTYNGMAKGSMRLSDTVKIVQTGKAHDYAFLMVIGIIMLILIVLIPIVI
ncbi:Na(+)/H(+) antiporter subunit D [Thermodesulfovibrio sp. TK110]